jgi:hypothetical protein
MNTLSNEDVREPTGRSETTPVWISGFVYSAIITDLQSWGRDPFALVCPLWADAELDSPEVGGGLDHNSTTTAGAPAAAALDWPPHLESPASQCLASEVVMGTGRH